MKDFKDNKLRKKLKKNKLSDKQKSIIKKIIIFLILAIIILGVVVIINKARILRVEIRGLEVLNAIDKQLETIIDVDTIRKLNTEKQALLWVIGECELNEVGKSWLEE